MRVINMQLIVQKRDGPKKTLNITHKIVEKD